MPIVATGFSCRDKNRRRALQSLLSGKLPRADRHHLGLRSRLDAVLPDGRAAARRVDEAASRRAPGGMALHDWQTGWQGALRVESSFPRGSQPVRRPEEIAPALAEKSPPTPHTIGVIAHLVSICSDCGLEIGAETYDDQA